MTKKSKFTAKTAFTKSMLPHNRRELFFDVVKLHYIELICLGLALFVFALPLIANVLVTDFYTAQLSGAVPDAEIPERILAEIVIVGNTSAFIAIPLMTILFVGVAGLLRVIRQYAWGEVVFLYRDFTIGIKQNVKQTALLGALVGVIIAGCTYLQNVADWNNDTSAYYFSSAAGAIALLFLAPIGCYMLVCISIYGNSFAQNFQQCIALYMKAPIKSILMMVLCWGVFLLLTIPNTVVRFGALICGILCSPFLLLGWYLFVYDQLDRYVNMEKHPSIVNKGIYVINKEEEL